ncbi:hypothetical protein [Streptomyces cyaneofuscatus]|uniref:hypothetical protein n=1 Tax=Streptomyces cyaneofuscatus TaxID=66883 RepID=UPI00342AAD29
MNSPIGHPPDGPDTECGRRYRCDSVEKDGQVRGYVQRYQRKGGCGFCSGWEVFYCHADGYFYRREAITSCANSSTSNYLWSGRRYRRLGRPGQCVQRRRPPRLGPAYDEEDEGEHPVTLPPLTNWHGDERPATGAETALAAGRAARVRREVADIRAAAQQMADGSPVEAEVAAFLTVQAELLERAGGEASSAHYLRPEQDTRQEPGMFPTAARSALLIARALLADGTGR